MNNKRLRIANKEKNDEFFTQYCDIENEVRNHTAQLAGKVIYCNADNPSTSNFVKCFLDNFENLKLSKLIATGYDIQGGI